MNTKDLNVNKAIWMFVVLIASISIGGGLCATPEIIESAKTPVEIVVEKEVAVEVEKVIYRDRRSGDNINYNLTNLQADVIECDEAILARVNNIRRDEHGNQTDVYFPEVMTLEEKRLFVSATPYKSVIWLHDIATAYQCLPLNLQTHYIIEITRDGE